VIAVDVQVVDKNGNPVGQIGPESFEVSINKQRRKVVSAQFLRHTRDATLPSNLAETPNGGGRTIILAIDNGSFEPGSLHEAMADVQSFLRRLGPNDRVGLAVFPTGRWIPPTSERTYVSVQLNHVIGEKYTLRSRYNLKPSEIVDITTSASNPSSFLTSATTRTRLVADSTTEEELDPVRLVQRRECPLDPDCPSRIYAEGMELAVQLENQTQASLNGLDALLLRLAEIPGRKSVVLVSAGVLVSDRPEGRPDIGDLGRILGQTAARANAVVYTLHLDRSASVYGSAARSSPGNTERGRERAMFAIFLDQFSSAAGGMRIDIPVGGGAFALDRVLRESSAYYLLGVEPAETDRDGKARQLRVKVDRPGVTVRSRQWVMVPVKERS